MVRRVSGMALLRYVFRSVSIWKGRGGRCSGPRRQGARLAGVTKDGTAASVPQDSDCRSESVLPEGHVHFTDEKTGQARASCESVMEPGSQTSLEVSTKAEEAG